MTLNDYLKNALQNHYAIGHFNFAAADVLRAIVEGAKEAGAPAVMVGTSEGEADFLGMTEAVALVKATREELKFPVFLNADHFKSFEKCRGALNAGYDTVLFDGSKLGYQENIDMTQKVKNYAGERPVEGELGYLRGSSEVQEKVQISMNDYTKPEEARDFVSQSGVDRLAVVFGNIHGIVTEQEEHLNIEYFKKIVEAIPNTPIVLHGASGLKDEDIQAAIRAGVANVHFNTELRVAYTKGLEKALEGSKETTPYKYMGPAADEVRKIVAEKVKVFMSASQ
jgi:ketose-bisphosphate aldolase